VFAKVLAPMLARLESSLPRGAEWRYEPKLDGFRGLLWRSENGQVHLLSRNLKDLSPCFPELVRAGDSLPQNTVLDGEASGLIGQRRAGRMRKKVVHVG
jgi:ATP-dependent DNA ligase